jgi:hypothetical protein
MDRTLDILQMIAVDPGKPGIAYREAGMAAADGARLTDMEARKLIVYRSGGWHLTGLGDARLLSRTDESAA